MKKLSFILLVLGTQCFAQLVCKDEHHGAVFSSDFDRVLITTDQENAEEHVCKPQCCGIVTCGDRLTLYAQEVASLFQNGEEIASLKCEESN